MLVSIYNHCGFVIKDLQNKKSDHHQLDLTPSFEVEGIRIVVLKNPLKQHIKKLGVKKFTFACPFSTVIDNNKIIIIYSRLKN